MADDTTLLYVGIGIVAAGGLLYLTRQGGGGGIPSFSSSGGITPSQALQVQGDIEKSRITAATSLVGSFSNLLYEKEQLASQERIANLGANVQLANIAAQKDMYIGNVEAQAAIAKGQQATQQAATEAAKSSQESSNFFDFLGNILDWIPSPTKIFGL